LTLERRPILQHNLRPRGPCFVRSEVQVEVSLAHGGRWLGGGRKSGRGPQTEDGEMALAVEELDLERGLTDQTSSAGPPVRVSVDRSPEAEPPVKAGFVIPARIPTELALESGQRTEEQEPRSAFLLQAAPESVDPREVSVPHGRVASCDPQVPHRSGSDRDFRPVVPLTLSSYAFL
jgi:hypothetical protein